DFVRSVQSQRQSLGANKGRTTGRVRGASVGQQAVDETSSSGLVASQHLLHRLRAVGLGADDVACQLESPKSQQLTWTGQAGAAIECRIGDPLVADLKGGTQQASVRRVDLLFERICQRPGLGVVQQDGLDHRLEQRRPLAVRAKGSPSEPAATPQIFADVRYQTAEVDELLTARKLRYLPASASAENCGLDVARHAEHNGLLRVDHQADARCSANQLVQLALAPSTVEDSRARTNRNGARVSPWSTPENVSKESDRPSGVITAALVAQYNAIMAEISCSGIAALATESNAFMKSMKTTIRSNWRVRASSMIRRRARICATMPRAGFFEMAMMCTMVHSVGAISPKSTQFITHTATSLATQWMRSASMGTSSRPSALPPGVFWARITTSAMVTGATLKLSSDGNGVSGGSVRMLGKDSSSEFAQTEQAGCEQTATRQEARQRRTRHPADRVAQSSSEFAQTEQAGCEQTATRQEARQRRTRHPADRVAQVRVAAEGPGAFDTQWQCSSTDRIAKDCFLNRSAKFDLVGADGPSGAPPVVVSFDMQSSPLIVVAGAAAAAAAAATYRTDRMRQSARLPLIIVVLLVWLTALGKVESLTSSPSAVSLQSLIEARLAKPFLFREHSNFTHIAVVPMQNPEFIYVAVPNHIIKVGLKTFEDEENKIIEWSTKPDATDSDLRNCQLQGAARANCPQNIIFALQATNDFKLLVCGSVRGTPNCSLRSAMQPKISFGSYTIQLQNSDLQSEKVIALEDKQIFVGAFLRPGRADPAIYRSSLVPSSDAIRTKQDKQLSQWMKFIYSEFFNQ
uniref:Sema domain-containing protein n=1 Tax=Macrostomum lignano TaxID=282301 RepID=A0A1I8GKI0_9PLAT